MMKAAAIPELSVVKITKPVLEYPVGTTGTVVHVYMRNDTAVAYEVEFGESVLTICASENILTVVE